MRDATMKIGYTAGEIDAIRRFVAYVNVCAEGIMQRTGIVEGAHWNAIQKCLHELEGGTTGEKPEAQK